MSAVREIGAKEMVATWASQTIACAISIRADETGKKLEDPGAWDQASDLWEATLQAAPSNADTATLMLNYSRNVFAWCDRHINR